MTRSYYAAPVPPLHVVDAAATANFTTFQDIGTLTATTTWSPIKIPANYLEVGTQLRVKAHGEFSTTVTPTLAVGIIWGAASVVLAQGNPTTTGSGAVSHPWAIEYEGRVRAIGTAGSIQGQGTQFIATSLTAGTFSPAPITAAARTVAIGTDVEKTIGVGAVWSAASASNTIKVTMLSVWIVS
jgi:hypothetical protein